MSLFAFLKQWGQPIRIEDAVMNQSVGIDIFWLIHQSKGDLAVFHSLLQPYLSAKEVHVVFDGRKTTAERREVLEERQTRRSHLQTTIDQIEEALPHMEERDRTILERHLHQLKRQAWKPSREYIDQIKGVIRGVIHEPDGEADQELIRLERAGIIDRIVTNDSDLIKRGAETVLHANMIFSTSHMRKQMGCTKECWEMFLQLCHKVEPLIAYSMVRAYGSVVVGSGVGTGNGTGSRSKCNACE